MPDDIIRLNGADLLPDLSGALFWPDRGLLAVADLHFEKGSSLAARGRLLPPYDTARTLDRLEAVVARLSPATVVAVGDSFHDRTAADRVASADVARIRRLSAGRDWIWIAGNHDPDPPAGWGGRVETAVTIGPLVFRHLSAQGLEASGEVCGHWHPVAAVATRARRLRCRCFVTDGRRLVLPAFGAYTGGLNVLDPAVDGLFDRGFDAHLLGRDAIYRFPRSRLSPDPEAPASV
jgi:DNA ligase-associated metallophosphoesterase